jgi:hypothetical protein
MKAMNIWLVKYAVFHHHSFMVKHSDENKRYVVTYYCGCPWTVCARKGNDGNWRITSVFQPHTCLTNVDDRKHAQLSSRFISQRLINIIKNCPLLTVTTLIEVVMVAWGYRVKYGRTCRAKQRALKLIYSDWAEAYERLPGMLYAMKAKNLAMHFEYVPKPEVMGPEGRQYFLHTFWTFGHCVVAFKYCCDVLSIDGTFFTGKYEGTMLIAIGIDVDCQLVPLAFAIVEKKNNDSWGWFLRLVRRVVVAPGCEIYVISNRHDRILNDVREVIPNHSRVHHRWCTRHLAQNLIKYHVIKENFKIFEKVCWQADEKDFKNKLKYLERRTNEKGKEFLKGLMDEKEKCALAYDKGGKHCGYMTSNMAEIFNSTLRGVRSLHVTVIASFTFYKCNEWFMKYLVDAQMVHRHHTDYVVTSNIYLDTKRYEARA